MHGSRSKIPVNKISSGSVVWRDLIPALRVNIHQDSERDSLLNYMFQTCVFKDTLPSDKQREYGPISLVSPVVPL
jgi:hypothetical protein